MSSGDEFYAFRVWVWIDSVLYCYLPFTSLAVLNVLIIRHMTSAARFRGTNASSDKVAKDLGPVSWRPTTVK